MNQTFVQIGQKYLNLSQVAFADFEPGTAQPADAGANPAAARSSARLRLFYSAENHVTLQNGDATRVKAILDRLLIAQEPA